MQQESLDGDQRVLIPTLLAVFAGCMAALPALLQGLLASTAQGTLRWR